MSALENAKTMSKEEVLEKIAALDIQEFGLLSGKLSEHLALAVEEAEEEGKEIGVVAALNNADTAYVLLDLLKTAPEKVLEGIAVVACALGTEKKVLCVPESEAELAESLKEAAEALGIEVKAEFINVRANKGNALIHIVTAANVAEAFEGGETGVYVSVNGGELKKTAPDTKISDLVDTSDAKALLLGYKLHKPEDAALTVAEAGVENGVINVLTGKDCIVCEAEKMLTKARKQSCGKCVFCREGLIQLQYEQKEITEGRGKMEYLDFTKEIGDAMTYSTPCSMGQTSSLIALSAAELFADEYEAHIKKKKCPAGTCTAFVAIYIDPQKCTGCEECTDVCPKDCIEGKAKYIHMIDEFDCTKCGKCIEACDEDAIVQTTGKVPKLPNRLTKVGKFKKR